MSEREAWRAELIEALGRVQLHVSDNDIGRLARGEDVTLSAWDLEYMADAVLRWAVGKDFPPGPTGTTWLPKRPSE